MLPEKAPLQILLDEIKTLRAEVESLKRAPADDLEILKVDDVCRLIRRSVPSLYRDMDEGRWPKPVRLGPNAVGWTRRKVREHIESLEPAD